MSIPQITLRQSRLRTLRSAFYTLLCLTVMPSACTCCRKG